ncbi:MAG TPA: tyrosine recombinase XerC [Rhodanobacteraceae bacterium]|nr:tyrosine recombinase XerC [Rhodanobacteraceae bacterium]
MTPAATVDVWLQRMAAERAPSPHTLAAYRRDLAKLTCWMQTRNIDDFARLTPDHLRGFVATQHRGGLAPSSLQRLLSSCRSLFAWLITEGRIEHDPAAGVRGPRTRRKLPQVLDADEAAALVEVPTDADALGVRDRAMLELFYSSGLRLSELVGLTWRDLELDEGLVRVLGKGSKTRVLPVGRYAVTALRELAAEVVDTDPGAPVFAGRQGRAISTRAVQKRMKQLALRQGIARNVHPHLLRHSFASHMLESSGDLRAVQELLGHADIGTTQIYTHLDFQHLAKVYDGAHPRARRKHSSKPTNHD